jgi:GldM C-terminal domain
MLSKHVFEVEKFLIFLLFFIVCNKVKAQDTIENSGINNAKPIVFVSPANTNVLYFGVDNPIVISAPGYADTDLIPTFSGGVITGHDKNGHYLVKPISSEPIQGRQCSISVSAKMPDGSIKSLGMPIRFSLKRVPDPVCYVANKKGDITISKKQLSFANKVQARMENFDFDVNFVVSSFVMVIYVDGNPIKLISQSDLFTEEMKTAMDKVQKGDHIIIQYVHVKGFDSRTIPGVNITIVGEEN